MTSCNKCGRETDKLFPSFGKLICQVCKDNRPNKGKGNSGVGTAKSNMPLVFENGVVLHKVKKSNGIFGKLFFEHYPGSRGIVGRCICYLVFWNRKFAGIIGVASPPINYLIFKNFFELPETNYVNNNVFRLVIREKNLGTRVLKVFRNTVKKEYESKYGDKLAGLVTFVEPPRTGAVYKADNWKYLGKTQGKRMRRDPETWEKTFTDDVKKHIYGYKYAS